MFQAICAGSKGISFMPNEIDAIAITETDEGDHAPTVLSARQRKYPDTISIFKLPIA